MSDPTAGDSAPAPSPAPRKSKAAAAASPEATEQTTNATPQDDVKLTEQSGPDAPDFAPPGTDVSDVEGSGAETADTSEDEDEPKVGLRITTPFTDKFVVEINGEPYVVLAARTEIPTSVADDVIEQGAKYGVEIEKVA